LTHLTVKKCVTPRGR